MNFSLETLQNHLLSKVLCLNNLFFLYFPIIHVHQQSMDRIIRFGIEQNLLVGPQIRPLPPNPYKIMGNRFNSSNSNSRQPQSQYGGGRRNRQMSPAFQQQQYMDDFEVPVKKAPKQKFDDDEQIALFKGTVEKLKEVDIEKLVKLEIKATQKVIKLDPKKDQNVPVMVSIKSVEEKKKVGEEVEAAKEAMHQNQRPGVDLICVIDVSGSMSGEKIELVKKSMAYLLEILTENDRLCIVTFESFAERLCPLLRVSPKNIATLEKHIHSLSGRGGTNIDSGMELALQTLQDKKYKNNVESIFLLSDGIDGGADQKVERNINQRIDLLKSSAFSVHTFGYGSDHDPKLMKNIANVRDGNFFYIDKLETLDEAFANCLGGLFSVIAEEVIITIKSKMHGMFADMKIIKAFGDITIYNKVKDEYNIKLSQFLSGISKNFILEMSIPATSARVDDLQRNQTLLQAQAELKPLGGKAPLIINSKLQVTFMNHDEDVKELDPDPEVMENFLRVKAVEIMKENLVLIEQRKFEDAKKNIARLNSSIEKIKGVERFEKVNNIRADMRKLEEQCDMQDHVNAERFLMEVERCHSREKNFAYQNCMQETMVTKAKMRKR